MLKISGKRLPVAVPAFDLVLSRIACKIAAWPMQSLAPPPFQMDIAALRVPGLLFGVFVWRIRWADRRNAASADETYSRRAHQRVRQSRKAACAIVVQAENVQDRCFLLGKKPDDLSLFPLAPCSRRPLPVFITGAIPRQRNHERKTSCQPQQSPQPRSSCSRSPRPSGATRKTAVPTTLSASREATRTTRESGRTQKASAPAISSFWRRSLTPPTARFSRYGKPAAKSKPTRSNRRPSKRPGRPSGPPSRRAVLRIALVQSRPGDNQRKDTRCQKPQRQNRLSALNRSAVPFGPAQTVGQRFWMSLSSATSRMIPSRSKVRRSASKMGNCSRLCSWLKQPISRSASSWQINSGTTSCANKAPGSKNTVGCLSPHPTFLPIVPTKCNAAREAGRVARFVSHRNHSECGTRRKLVAGFGDFRFIRRMSRVVKGNSELCASRARHAMEFSALAENPSLQLAKEGGALRLILPWLPHLRQGGTRSRFHTSAQERA